MDMYAAAQDLVNDVAFNLTNLEPGNLVGLPDGSDVEVNEDEDGSGFFARTTPDNPFIITPYANFEEKAARAISISQAAFVALSNQPFHAEA